MMLPDIALQRLHNQHLLTTSFTQPEEVVGWLGAVQAQEYPGASWALAQRAQGMTQPQVDLALAHGRIIRTHVMRPTWHFATAADIRWLLMLTAPRVHQQNGTYYRKLALDSALFTRAMTVLADRLQDGKQCTRNELAEALERNGVLAPNDDRLRLTYLLMYAELEGLICSAGLRGKQHTYMLLDEHIPATAQLSREEALAELTKRFFTSHGPALVNDFTWWSNLTTADAMAGIALNRGQLESLQVDGKTYWFAERTPLAPRNEPIAHLLPAYDEYTNAYKDHSTLYDPRYSAQVIASAGIVIVVDGVIVGAWKRVIERQRVVLRIRRFHELTPEQEQALDRAIERYSAFLAMPIVRDEANR